MDNDDLEAVLDRPKRVPGPREKLVCEIWIYIVNERQSWGYLDLKLDVRSIELPAPLEESYHIGQVSIANT